MHLVRRSAVALALAFCIVLPGAASANEICGWERNDTDYDGVLDDVDRCDTQHRGAPVDDAGCAIDLAAIEDGLPVLHRRLAFTADGIASGQTATLDALAAAVIAADTPLRVYVAQSPGDDPYQPLAARAELAEAVRAALVARGADADRLLVHDAPLLMRAACCPGLPWATVFFEPAE